MSVKRDRTIDIMKGIGILLIIISHITNYTPSAVKIWIRTFGVELFFFCSGLVFSYGSFSEFLRKKLRTLVLPYFCLGISLWLLSSGWNAFLFLISKSAHEPVAVKDMLLGLLLGHRLHKYYYSLWFVAALFAGEIVFFLLVKLFGNRRPAYLLFFIPGILFQNFIFRFVVIGWYWSIDTVPACVSFLCLGYFFRLSPRLRDILSGKWVFITALAGNIYFCVLNFRRNQMPALYYGTTGMPLFYGLAAAFGIIMVMSLSEIIRESAPLEYFGRNSLIVYAFQQTFAIRVGTDIASMLERRYESFSDMYWVVIFGVTILISVILIELINTCFPRMIGKKRRPPERKLTEETYQREFLRLRL